MKNKVLDKITEFAIQELKKECGYCGCAISDNIALLNSADKDGHEINIDIKIES